MSSETSEKTPESATAEASEPTWKAPRLPSWVPGAWNQQAQRGVDRLEALWKEAQKAQVSGVQRARAAITSASEQLGSAASELRSKGSELAQRAQEKFGGRSAQPESAEPVTPPTPPESDTKSAPEA